MRRGGGRPAAAVALDSAPRRRQQSEGKYVSLGYFEKDDLRVVVDHLRGSGTVSTIAVWGRSMGAVTGILYQEQVWICCAQSR
jgi:hypothetical protein